MQSKGVVSRRTFPERRGAVLASSIGHEAPSRGLSLEEWSKALFSGVRGYQWRSIAACRPKRLGSILS